MYESSVVFLPGSCQEEIQPRVCSDGTWSAWGSLKGYQETSCVVENPCPTGFVAVGTLSTGNDIIGPGLGQTFENTIEDCEALCDENENCVAFMYGGHTVQHPTMDMCELAATVTPNGDHWDNFLFCARGDFSYNECPSGYTQVGTLSTNNDIAGPGLGQYNLPTVEACRAKCEQNDECIAFMYGGDTYVHPDMDKCELSAINVPDTDFWDNFLFCSYDGIQFAQLTSEQCAENLPYGECGSSYNYDFSDQSFMCTDAPYADYAHKVWDQYVWDSDQLVYTIQWTFDEPKTLRERFLDAVEIGEHVVYEIRVPGLTVYTREQVWRFAATAEENVDHTFSWYHSSSGDEDGFSLDDGAWFASSTAEINGHGSPSLYPDMFGVANFNSRDTNENRGCGNYYFNGQKLPSPYIKVEMFMR